MELEDLKSIWKGNVPFEAKQADEISAMLNGRSNSIVNKLKRSVWFELIVTLAVGVVMLYLSFTLKSGAMKWSIVAVLILFLAYLIYYIKKINLLNRFDASQQNIRENLEKLVNDLNAYLQFYKTSYTILYPVYFLLGLMFAALERGFDVFWEKLGQPETILKLTFFSFILVVLSLFISKWYLKKLYGNHLHKLKELLGDIHDATQGK
jgi:membrane protein implicated in regulation of membrane protease activity